MINMEIHNKYNECQKMFTTNRKLLALIEEHHYDDKIYTSRTIDYVEKFFTRKFDNLQYLEESATLTQLNGALQVGLAVQGHIQLENSANLEKARQSVVEFDRDDDMPCYNEDDDYIYYWDPIKHQINIDKHDINLYMAIDYFNHTFESYYYIGTIVDEKHPNTHHQYRCVDGKLRYEVNYARYIFSYDEDDRIYNTVKIVYNVRYSAQDDKYVVKFVTAFVANVPQPLRAKFAHIYKKALTLNEQTYLKGDNIMKFMKCSTGEIVDFSDRVDSLTSRDLIAYRCLDEEAAKLATRLIIIHHRTANDLDKIFSYEDIMYDGAWYDYYNYRPLTDVEWDRRKKYYEGNRIVFNEQLDKMRANNPNFVKMFKKRFEAAKNAITYGAPQSIVRSCMAKLYGDQVLDLLVEEDPQDAILDPNLRKWKFV